MQDTGNALEIKRPATENNLVYIQTAISKPQGKHKPKSTTDTHKKEKQSKHNTKYRSKHKGRK